MPRFEVHIPAADSGRIGVTLRVDAEHWMAALKAGLHKLGEQGFSVQNVLVDVQDDGSVQVTESRNGRVLEIRELRTDGAAAKPSGQAPQPQARSALTQAKAPAAIGVHPPARNDEHPTLLDLPAPAAAQPIGEAVASSAKDGSRRDSGGWPWAASLSPQGEVEGIRADGDRPPAPRAPPPAKRPPPATVIDLQQPTRAVKGPIGRALSQNKQREQIEDVLADVFERVQGAYAQKGEQSALYLLLDLALEKIPAESGSVLLMTSGTGDLAFAGARGPKASELLQSQLIVPAGVGIAGFCAVEGVSVALSDVQRDPRWYSEVSERLQYETKSVLCAPMMTHGRSFGCIQLINRNGTAAFTEHEVGMLSYIAHQGALYLNSRS
jgi:hypothetical protein